MTRLGARLICTWLACFALGAIASAADWPQRTGPYRNNSTPEIVRPWHGALESAWQIPLGEGYSSPAVAAGRLFLHAKVQDKDEEEVLALDSVTGKRLWRFAYRHAPFESNVGNGPRAAPTVALGRVYTYGITGILTCLQADTGEKLWQTNPLESLHAPIMMFGASAYPIVDGDRIYVPVGAPGAGLAALDTETGEVVWKAYDDPPTSVPATLFQPRVGGVLERHLVYESTRGLAGFNPADGSLLWEYRLADRPIGTLPPPAVVGDLLIASSMQTGTVALRLERSADGVRPVEAWRNPTVTCYFTQSVPIGSDYLYILNATLMPEAEIALSCLDARTGRELWKKDKVGLYQLNMIRTGDNRLLMLDDTHGDLILLDANPQEYRELARAKACNPTIITPALANGRVYLRDDRGVTCIPLKTD